MKVWELWRSAKSTLLTVCTEKDNIFDENFRGKPLASSYEPIKLKVQRIGQEEDFPNLASGALIFSKQAQTVIGPLIAPYAEVLEIDHSEISDIEIALINVTNVVAALDYGRTTFKYDACSGEISGFNSVHFQLDKVMHNPIFRIPEKPVKLYVTDEFRDLVIQHELKGFVFEEVWDSEYAVDMKQARQQYEAQLATIEQKKGEEVPFLEALALVEADKAMASGKWKLQADPANNVLLGELMLDGDYEWITPMSYPPILSELYWHEVELNDFEE
ncbi:imm11 family protein [Paenibacillus sp. MMS18-CY102]|uniref:imm11 family protein n=1 Tax=Paenibacillus sp. MMS18-CY102 TaxID=2682849 RepID=UPI0013657ECC|nr:DUF1629 domain-containing protein [Paenibacillus sp. MMS18-CY102]MWC29701.1 hypothetical protein [Paenibacillus sp. MMS18-CY102]